MTNIRIIPCLLMQNKKLVKTKGYKKPQYIGDPLNTIKLFNNLFVDEIILLDINQSFKDSSIDFEYLELLASECFIPMCYGGGIRSLETAIKIYSLGFEKLSINMTAAQDPQFIKSLSSYFGSQSVVCSIDCKKNFWGQYKVYPHNKKRTRLPIIDYAKKLEQLGAGELIINAIHKDGYMTGYDLDLLEAVAENISIPIIANCGAGSLSHMKSVSHRTGINAFAAGSLFVYNGPLRAILINYPNKKEIRECFYD